jgi:5-aminopentanamidase
VTRIVCQQVAPRIADLAANRDLSVAAIRRAVGSGADIVVLPELVTSGYVFASRAEAASVAITPDHALFRDWAAEAALGPALVVAGFCELGSDGLLYDSAAVVDHSGVVAIYRKTHLWDGEKRIFAAGTEAPTVIDTPAGRMGVLVCYDLEFPEMTRLLALHGADVVLVPANWPLVARPPGERPPEVIIAMAAARTNRVVIACCDRTGRERGQDWTAATTLINESGWVIAEAGDDASAMADFDLTRSRSKALSPFNDALEDRRPELYGDLSRENIA